LRAQAHFDGEVDAISAAEIERHTEHCVQCRELLDQLERTRAAIRRSLPLLQAPPHLRARITNALDQEAAAKVSRRVGFPTLSWRIPMFWAGALSGIGATGMTAVLAIFLLSAWPSNPLLEDLVAAHVRSLMPAHLIDVVSTDQHTVKPWFSGHADVSPVVADFTQQGYRLVGGRADYLDHQRAAVVVYQHGRHTINVFSWVAGSRPLTGNTTRSGYHVVSWTVADLQYCAISDTGWDELLGLVTLLRAASADDARRQQSRE
jgi:anti-sigma factor RsiW